MARVKAVGIGPAFVGRELDAPAALALGLASDPRQDRASDPLFAVRFVDVESFDQKIIGALAREVREGG